MITSNVFQRVFHLRYGQGTGTCFAIDFEEKQYIVTAKHVVKGLQDYGSVELFYNGNWQTFSIRLIGHHTTADVSVFAIEKKIAEFPLDPTTNGIAYGQDVYFLGFPYQMSDKASSTINRNFPLPLVKKGVLSAILNDGFGNYLLIDGINNLGFSGGPVVYQPLNQKDFKVGGIISGYRFTEEPVYQSGVELNLTVKMNTGIIVAYNIENAIDLIRKNPIGVSI